MPLPRQKRAFALLVRQEPPTDEEWLELLEARRVLIRPHFDSFTLPTLGHLECLYNEMPFTHRLPNDAPTLTGDEGFSLETQGIFCAPHLARKTIPESGWQPGPGGSACPDGTLYIWGLTRKGQWILAKVVFKGKAGYKERGYEKAQTVDIRESTLPEIVAQTKTTPYQIWLEIGQVIKDWAKFRRGLYECALGIADQVETEEDMLALVLEKAE